MNTDDQVPITAQYTVIFQPSGQRGQVEEGTTILEAAQQLGVGIQNLCGGAHTCGRCRVKIMEGQFDKENITSRLSHLTPLSEREQEYLERNDFERRNRFACEARVMGDLMIFIPQENRLHRQIIRKGAGKKVISLNPTIRLYFVELDPPAMEDEDVGDVQLLFQTLEEQFDLNDLTIDYHALLNCQEVIRQENWTATVTIWKGEEIVRVQPGFHDVALGLAVDIGTTTIAAYLCDLETGKVLETLARMNPQVSYGEDIMSRISYVKENGEEGLDILHNDVIGSLNGICRQVTDNVGLATDDIAEVTLVGNTVMHHLVLGLNPTYLGSAPFRASTSGAINIKARDLGLGINPAANVYVLPIKAGYVGADNMGVVLAEQPHKQDEKILIIDVGTNGEILLGSRNRILSASSPTGPAFEGAQITHGMRAAEGATERVRINPETFKVQLQVIGKEGWSDSWQQNRETVLQKQGKPTASANRQVKIRGICGSGIIDAVAEMYRAGIINPSGAFNEELESERVIAFDGLPAFVLADETDTATGEKVVVTLADVRNVQLAKAALYTGVRVLMNELGIEQVDRVILTGAFGSYIDPIRAMILGLFPDCDPQRVFTVGNAAGDGARIALLDRDKRKEIDEVSQWIEHVTIPLTDEFQELYMESLAIPHADDTFDIVDKWVNDSMPIPEKFPVKK